MIRTTAWTAIGAGVLLLAATADVDHLTAAVGGPARNAGPGPAETGGGRCAESDLGIQTMRRLGPTAEQRRQIIALESEREAKLAPLRIQMQTKCTELHALWRTPSLDPVAIGAKAAEMDAVRQAITDAVTSYELGVLRVLTLEQRTRIEPPAAIVGFGPGPPAGACSCYHDSR